MRSMRNRTLLPLLLAFACTSPPASHQANDSPTAGKTWNEQMEHVDALCSELTALLLKAPQGDLKRAAAAANEAAEVLRRGYGEQEDKRVPNYARMARDCESWLLQVALEARQAHGDLAAELYRTGRRQHCNDCHDAFDRIGK